jgi:hypothetical protein
MFAGWANPEQWGAVKFVDRVGIVLGRLDGGVDRKGTWKTLGQRSHGGDDRPQKHFDFRSSIGKPVAKVTLQSKSEVEKRKEEARTK